MSNQPKYNPTTDDLDRALARRVADHKADGGADWAAFSARRTSVPIVKSRRWMGAAAAAMVLLSGLVGGGGYLLGWYDQVEEQALALTETKLHIAPPQEDLIEAEAKPGSLLAQARVSRPPIVDFTMPVSVATPTNEVPATPTADSSPETPEPVQTRTTRSANATAYGSQEPTPIRRRSKNRLQIGAYAALGSSGSTPNKSPQPQFAAAMEYTVGKYQGNMAFTPEDMKHDFPVTVGVSLDIPLVPRLRLSTGLLYTYIHSSASTSMGAEYRYDYQTHYLGLPVSLSYDFLVTRPVGLYVTGGTAIELALASTERSEVRAATGSLISEKSGPVDTRGVMASFNLGVGVNVHLSPRVGLYAEPGITSYLSNDTHPINFRTASPVQFSLRAGIRVKL